MSLQEKCVNIYTNEESIEYKEFQSIIDVSTKLDYCSFSTDGGPVDVFHLIQRKHVSIISEFAKKLPSFERLPQDDQCTLLTNGGRDIVILWMARKYDIETNSIISFQDETFSRENFEADYLGDIFDDLLELGQLLHSMKVNDMEYSLLGGISLLSEHTLMVTEGDDFKIARDLYMKMFKEYLTTNYGSEGAPRFSKLLTVLPKLRLLCNLLHTVFLFLKSRRFQFLPLIEEIWRL